MPNKWPSLNQFLTLDEIAQAILLHNKLEQTGGFAQAFASQVITPNLNRINKALGQENDPMYLAYMVEFILNEIPRTS
jgi:hypothetical protein